jgi:tetratricopeptide (TPR) repeat protein
MGLLAAGAGAVWRERVRGEERARHVVRERRLGDALDEAEAHLRRRRLAAARHALGRAEGLLVDGDSPGHQRAARLRRDLDLLARLEVIALEQARTDVEANLFNERAVVPLLRAALEDYGLRRGRPAKSLLASPVADELLEALERWAELTRDPEERAWLAKVFEAAGRSEGRTMQRWRRALARGDRRALVELARDLEVERLSPSRVVRLARQLGSAAGVRPAVDLLRRAQPHHAGDFWVNESLGLGLLHAHPPDVPGATRYLTAAVALRPDSAGAWVNLGVALRARSRQEAERAGWRNVELPPGRRTTSSALHEARTSLDAAATAFRRAVRLRPSYAEAHYNLGVALQALGQREDAIAAYRRAIELKPGMPGAHNNLGMVLHAQGKLDDAVASYKKAIELQPDSAQAHNNLGLALHAGGKLAGAVASFRRAIRLQPDHAEAHGNLGAALQAQGKPDEAAVAYRDLGLVLHKQGKLGDAIGAYRQAIKLRPQLPDAHYNLGIALQAQGKPDEAARAYCEAIRRAPDYAEAHCNLGMLLKGKGKYDQALVLLKRGHELGSRRADWNYPSARWVRQAEQAQALARKLPAILKGEASPADNAERLALAEVCYERSLYAAAARLWSEALAADPRLARYRYPAARAAALAGTGKGLDDPPPDAKARAGLRKQARDWLKADLAAYAKVLAGKDRRGRDFVRRRLLAWQADADLAGLRGGALEKLSAEEREAWRKLWGEVAELLQGAGEPG